MSASKASSAAGSIGLVDCFFLVRLGEGTQLPALVDAGTMTKQGNLSLSSSEPSFGAAAVLPPRP